MRKRSSILLSFFAVFISNLALAQDDFPIRTTAEGPSYQTGENSDACIKDVNTQTFISTATSGSAFFLDLIADFSAFDAAVSGFKVVDIASCTQRIPVELLKGFYVSTITTGMNYDLVKTTNTTAGVSFSGTFTQGNFFKFSNGSRSFGKTQVVDQQEGFQTTISFDRENFFVKAWCNQQNQESLAQVFQSTIGTNGGKSTIFGQASAQSKVQNYFVSFKVLPCFP